MDAEARPWSLEEPAICPKQWIQAKGLHAKGLSTRLATHWQARIPFNLYAGAHCIPISMTPPPVSPGPPATLPTMHSRLRATPYPLWLSTTTPFHLHPLPYAKDKWARHRQ